jgi:putative ABC transport system permease protein
MLRLVPYRKGSFKTRFRLKENLCNLPRSLLMLTGIMASSLFMMTGFLFYSSMDFVYECNFNTLFGYQYQYVYNTLKTENATAGEPYMMASYYYETDGGRINFTIHGTAEDPHYIRLKDDSGQEIDPSKTVATRSAARRLGWKKGDTVTVVSNSTLSETTLTIDEICDIRYSDYVFMPMKRLNGMLNLNGDTHIGVYSVKPLQMDQGIVEDVLTAEDARAGTQASVAAFHAYLYILAGFSSLISLIVVYIVTTMLIEENRKNISLMKVMGYQDKEVSRLMLHSTSILAFLGFALAIPITLSLIRAFFGMLTSNMFFDFVVNLSLKQGLLSLALVLTVYYLTLFMNKRKVQRINMAESLKARE